jgi:hypothetical protein
MLTLTYLTLTQGKIATFNLPNFEGKLADSYSTNFYDN